MPDATSLRQTPIAVKVLDQASNLEGHANTLRARLVEIRVLLLGTAASPPDEAERAEAEPVPSVFHDLDRRQTAALHRFRDAIDISDCILDQLREPPAKSPRR